MKVIEERIEDNYRIIIYDNGTIVRELISNGVAEERPLVIPPSPLEVLKKENLELKLAMAEQTEKYDAELLAIKLALAEQTEGGVK